MEIDEFFCGDFPIVEGNGKERDQLKVTRQEKEAQREIKFKLHREEKRKEKHLKEKQCKLGKLQQFETQEEKINFLKQQKQIKTLRIETGLLAQNSKYTIVIDCAFEQNMNIKEERSLARQIFELYTENRRVKYPMKLYLTNLYPQLEEILKDFNYDKWPIMTDKRPFHEIQELQNIVYLSPDADEELTEIKENEVYVIGGLVDRVIMKNATLNRARSLNVRTAKLPISQFIKASYKKCLNVSTAALMIPTWLEYRNWETTFEKIVPPKFQKMEKMELMEQMQQSKQQQNIEQQQQQ